jgi:Vault protein inter-alpha-trypsin domain
MPTAGIFPSNRPGSSFPLKSSTCHYRLVDVQVLATLVQEYVSDSFEDVNVSYVFPLPPDAGVCSFKAVIDDQRVIDGLVKEKSVAKAEYKKAVAQGKTAGLLEKQHADGKFVRRFYVFCLTSFSLPSVLGQYQAQPKDRGAVRRTIA